MEFKLGLAQTKHPADGDVVRLVEQHMAQAAQLGVDLLVFPESLMTRYEESKGDFLAAAQPCNGPFAQAVNGLAATYGIWTAYTVNELNENGKPFNTAMVCDSDGNVRGTYRKVHLFDSATTQESQRMAAGDALLEPLDTPFCKLGLAICYDLRFPELARHMALAGCELMLYPAAWVAGPGKARQWKTLLAARAIEDEMFVAGVSRCDEGYSGTSCIVDPFGKVLACAGDEPELIVHAIDTALVREAHEKIPVFEHRRPDLY